MKWFPRNKKKVIQSLLMIGSLLGAAAINYTIISNPIVFVMIAALFIHELGHFYVARKRKANPDLPYFIPLFPFLIGITRIKNLDPKDAPAVILAGPAFAILFTIFMIIFNLYYKLFSFVSLFFILGFEIIINYFGSDGQKYRKIKAQPI
jgi:hypothetical protein